MSTRFTRMAGIKTIYKTPPHTRAALEAWRLTPDSLARAEAMPTARDRTGAAARKFVERVREMDRGQTADTRGEGRR